MATRARVGIRRAFIWLLNAFLALVLVRRRVNRNHAREKQEQSDESEPKGRHVLQASVSSTGSEGLTINALKQTWGGIKAEDFQGDTPIARNCHATGINGHLMIVFGGVHMKNVALDDVVIYNLEENRWYNKQTTGTKPSKRYCHSANVWRNKLIVFGGFDPATTLRQNDVHYLDLDHYRWVQPAIPPETSPEPRSHHRSVVYGNKLLVFGGLSGKTMLRLNDVQLLDLESWRWSTPQTKGNAPSQRLFASLNIWRNKLVLFGGYTGNQRLNDVHLLDLATWTWIKPLISGPVPSARYGHSTMVLGNKLLVYGGNAAREYHESDLHLLDLDTMSWIALEEQRSAIGHAYHTGVLYQNKIFYWGGKHSDESVKNDITILDYTTINALKEVTFDEAVDRINNTISRLSTAIGGSSEPTIIESAHRDRMSRRSLAPVTPQMLEAFERNEYVPPPTSPPRSGRPVSMHSHLSGGSRPSTGLWRQSQQLGLMSITHEVDDVVRTMRKQFNRLMEERKYLQYEASALDKKRSKFEDEKKRMAKYLKQHNENQKIRLSVGGTEFCTTLSTLTNDRDSMLASMFSGRYNVTKDESGCVFIDRDGTHFRYILNYLRDGAITLPKDEILYSDLLREAKFYLLGGLIEHLEEKLKAIEEKES